MSKKSSIQGKTPMQALRAKQATGRQAAYELRTPEEQLLLLDSRPGDAVKERARLGRLVMTDNEVRASEGLHD